MNNVDAERQGLANRGFGQGIALFLISLGLLLTFGISMQAVSVRSGLVFTLLVVVLLPAVLFAWGKKVGVVNGLRLRRVPFVLLVFSALLGVGAWSIAIAIHALMEQALGPALDVGLGIETVADYLVMLLIAAVLPGVCEESLFRGAIQGVLERRGSWFAVLLTGFLFGLFHLDPWRILPAAFLGCVFGWLTIRTQSIVPAIVAHTTNNTVAISVGYFQAMPPTWLLVAMALCGLGSAYFIFKQTASPSELGPLAHVPAGLNRFVAWGLGVVTTLVAAGGVALAVFIVSAVTVVAMNDDALAPRIMKGDQLVVMKRGSFAYRLDPGDTVSFRRDSQTVTRVVAQIDDQSITVHEAGGDVVVAVEEVIGQVVHHITVNPQMPHTDPLESNH